MPRAASKKVMVSFAVFLKTGNWLTIAYPSFNRLAWP